MTTGRRPFTKSDLLDLVVTMARRPPRADAGDARVPRELADIIAKALEVDAADRFQSAVEMGAALQSVQASLSRRAASGEPAADDAAAGDRRAVSDHDSARRRRLVIAAAVTALVVAAIGLGTRRNEPQ